MGKWTSCQNGAETSNFYLHAVLLLKLRASTNSTTYYYYYYYYYYYFIKWSDE